MAILGAGILGTSSAFAFTQIGGGGALPMGHEWLTRTSALEVLNAEHIIPADPQDPRTSWVNGLAKNTDLSSAQNEVDRLTSIENNNARFEPRYDDVYAAIMGERWVDMAGFNVVKSTTGKFDCFDAVAQEPADLQEDHYMRRYDDIGAEGGVIAARRAQQRFIMHFVNAAMAEKKSINAWDGGAYSSKKKLDQNYFLFGRAVHLFQDSFSPEHTVRLAEDNYERVHQVKAYLCSEGAEQHTHDTKAVLNFTSGDVIWKPNTRLDSGWASYKVSSMKDVGLVAMEASKDLWAAFIRTMAVPRDQREAVAQEEAQTLVTNWLDFDEQEMLDWYENEEHRDHSYVLEEGQTGKGKSQYDCMIGLGVTSGSQAERVAELDQLRRQCLYNVQATPGYSDMNDTYMHIPYNWQWKSKEWLSVPDDWTMPELEADTGKTVTIKNAINGNPMTAPDGVTTNSYLYSKEGEAIEFVMVGDPEEGAYFRAKDDANLFLSYKATSSGRAKLFNSPKQAAYKVEEFGVLWGLKNTYWDQYLWFDQNDESVHLTREGDTDQAHSLWIIDGL
ncbi:hypothetical protein GCM10007876_13570 [Litoribrevibacter albus]|uniref:Hemolysin D n=2 Tax=Litoribrevibacter albus TaxID=1473156 RepID=A0AA37S9F8_9GAMM|nr:hypothetical protein GCM10007876_13570 [Litoribrevibacter albus]